MADKKQSKQPQKAAQKSDACPKCGSPLVEASTRSGRKLRRCSTNVWDPTTHTASGCDYVEWVKATVEETDDKCPECGSPLVLMHTATGKELKKCSTGRWNRQTKSTDGCPYIQWL